MKPDFVRLLWCPDCKGELTLKTTKVDKDEVIEGILTCVCGRTFPIKDGISIMLHDEFRVSP